ncbi:MAG: hypothetical protein PHO10_12205 [Gemmiger sp.]|nr:hypothetical protein [Gemmiger sp.]
MRGKTIKTLALATALALAATLLPGCATITLPYGAYGGGGGEDWYQSPDGEDWYQAPGGEAYGGGEPLPNLDAEDIQYGSAKLISQPTAIVSIYLDEENGNTWTDEEIAESRRRVAAAAGWVIEQCRDYGTMAAFHVDDGTPDSPLFYHTTYRGQFLGDEDSGEGEEFDSALNSLCAALDDDTLHERYGTDSVAFLVFLPVAGASYTMVHYAEDGSYYYYEYSCIYQEDIYALPGTQDPRETAMVYAHELLHQFGAPDLYEGSNDAFVTPELTAFVAETWPDAIMYSADNAEVENPLVIPRNICPVTAYCLGLTTGFEGLENFPALAAVTPGVFSSGEFATPESGATPWQSALEAIPAGWNAS